MSDVMLLNANALIARPYQPHHLAGLGELTVMPIIMDKHGRIILVLPQRGERLQYQPVQGRVKPGELPYDAGLRELGEELNLASWRFQYDPDVALGVHHSPEKGKVILGLFYWWTNPVERLQLNLKENRACRLVDNWHALSGLMRDCSAVKATMIIDFLRAATEMGVHPFSERWGIRPR